MTIRTVAMLAGVVLLASHSYCSALAKEASKHPAGDPKNEGGWHLNKDLSDDFEGRQLDTKKWFIQGTEGKYRSNFIGRAPSQFSTKNVRIEAGKLKLATKWDPDFEFSDKIDRSDKKAKDGRPYENITTAAVISKRQLLYGYMEIKCKAADASVTSSFWMTGNNSELDVFEFLGRPKQEHKKQLPTELWSSIHDWSKKGVSTWTDRMQLPFRVADDFHVYGIEWDRDYLKFHADGKLVRTVTRKQVGDEGWVIDGPLWIWVDSETFPWHGVPEQADLPVDYEIEYIRIWQKSLGDNIFLSFEGPTFVQNESKDWWIADEAKENFSLVDDKANSGNRSLQFKATGPLKKKVVAFAPYGSLDVNPGNYTFSMKAWLEPGSTIKRLHVVLEDPWLELKPFDLTSIETGKWVTLTQSAVRRAPSGPKDRVRILVQPDDLTGDTATLYLDDLSFEKTR